MTPPNKGSSDGGVIHDELMPLPTDDGPIDLSDLRPEDTIVFVIFWVLGGVVFLQFFSRYVLNSSVGWTEEIARYLLIGVTFVGSAMAVRKRSHIAVEFIFRYFGERGLWRLQILNDAICVVFFGACAWISAQLSMRTKQLMASVDLSKNLIYWTVCAGFVAMTIYGLHNLWRSIRHEKSHNAGDIPGRIID